MVLSFQYPGGTASTLLQRLTDLSTTAVSGGAAFAWATASGVSALLSSPDFEAFLARGDFRLVVGTDSITDAKAVARLKKAADQHPRLKVEMLINDAGSLFHPKLAWFATHEKLVVVVGSGNLTKGGLLGNWEAFETVEYPLSDLAALVESLDEWLTVASPGLLPLSDPRVLDRVEKNSGDERSVTRRATSPTPALPAVSDVSDWWIAELNKSRKNASGESLFSQASFDESTFRRFFNYTVQEVDVLLFPVNDDGSVAALESRKGRYKAASVNYYFELGSVQGVPYPAQGRPIAVFGRLLTGGYIYRVFLPGSPGFAELEGWLLANVSISSAALMRRSPITTDELVGAWPANPLLRASLPGS